MCETSKARFLFTAIQSAKEYGAEFMRFKRNKKTAYFHCYTVQYIRIYKLLNQLFALVSFCSKNFYAFKTFLHLLKY
jgi:hypothetical protein